MSDLIDRQVAIDLADAMWEATHDKNIHELWSKLIDLPSAQPDARLKKIADLVDGTIDHFDRDDAMDLLYQIKEVLKDG